MDKLYLIGLQPMLYLSTEENCIYRAFATFLLAFNICGRPLFVTYVCLECYMAVLHPVTYRTRKGLTSRILIAIATWVVTIMYGLYFVWNSLNLFDLTPVGILITTLPIIVFCDISVWSTLKKSGPTGKPSNPQKRRALRIITSSCIITVISYLPPITSRSILQLEYFKEATFDACVILMPSLCITTAGNAISIQLHVANVGHLHWLKSWLKGLYK